MLKTVGFLLLCFFICLILCSCIDSGLQIGDVTQYLNSFTAMDYEMMYSFTAPAVDIDKETFVQKYEAVFSGLGVTEIVINDLSGPDNNGVFSYTATYKTKEYGDFTNDYKLKAMFSDSGGAVLWDYSLIFPEMEKGSSVRVRTLKASRGEIFAADGSLLAKNAYADTIYMDTSKVQDITDVADAICPITGMTSIEIIDKFNSALEKGTKFVVLGAFFSDELTELQKQNVLLVPGLGIDDQQYTPIRNYPLGEKASHIIGYIGYGDNQTKREKVGVVGLEAAYEDQLCGQDGKIIFIEDRWGNNIRTLYEIPCEQGQDLRLTIDPSLQQKAYDALGTCLQQGQTGVAIVMDASTGYVEATVSYPSYDNNVFTFPVSEEIWQQLNSADSDKPLVSRATQGLYPPGSVLKPFTAAVALDSKVITPETIFDGKIVDNQWTPDEEGWNWQSITRIDDSGTPLKLYNALVCSDNIYFAYIALKLGDEKFIEYLERIGMEQAVPFDLPIKKANAVNATTSMYRKLLADMGYGQGELLVTPVQLAAMYTAFANGTGDMYQPVLVQKICQTKGFDYNVLSEKQPSVWVEDVVSNSSLDILTPILKDVINSGTGRPARIPGVDIAGKTGTAEIGNDKSREISWFAGYWLNGYYDRLVIVMVDVAAGEGAVKFDIAKTLLKP
ncbi:MAG: penicillin-binding transpeptidase domain-containing protein [Christensenellales bacterium]|jgi:cell division protein FtsI/penicillin-binding protein 2